MARGSTSSQGRVARSEFSSPERDRYLPKQGDKPSIVAAYNAPIKKGEVIEGVKMPFAIGEPTTRISDYDYDSIPSQLRNSGANTILSRYAGSVDVERFPTDQKTADKVSTLAKKYYKVYEKLSKEQFKLQQESEKKDGPTLDTMIRLARATRAAKYAYAVSQSASELNSAINQAVNASGVGPYSVEGYSLFNLPKSITLHAVVAKTLGYKEKK
jgi:hypothetical protein